MIGASAEDGKIGNSVMKNLINGGYKGEIYPDPPQGRPRSWATRPIRASRTCPARSTSRSSPSPPSSWPQALIECGEKKIPGAVLIPSGFAETGNVEGQKEIQEIGRKYDIRLMGPNIYGFYYTPENLCATFCTRLRRQGPRRARRRSPAASAWRSSASRARPRWASRPSSDWATSPISTRTICSPSSSRTTTPTIVAMHCEDLKDGRSFAEVAKRVSKKKPVVVLKAGRTAAGAQGGELAHRRARRQRQDLRGRAASSRASSAPGRCATCSNSPAACRCCRRRRARTCVIITGAGGSGVLLSDACVDNGLSLMKMPPDLDAAFRKFIPPFGAAGNPVDITGGEPPQDLPEHHPPRARRPAHPRADPRLLAHHHHAADGLRRSWSRGGRRIPRPRASRSRSWPRSPATCRSRRRRNSSTTTAFRPTPIRPRSRWRCSAPSTNGRAAPASSEASCGNGGFRSTPKARVVRTEEGGLCHEHP